uniref:Uncharacterized protein n=1 Tax=viral metagenome TaxID=1070528 RepID=A0A6M3XMZ9_9ZZZZ
MKSLKERLKGRKKDYARIVASEYVAEIIIEKITPILPDINVIIYPDNIYVYISVKDIEDFEESSISELSSLFDLKWDRSIEKDTISYYSYIEKYKRIISLTVSAKPTDSCKIIRIPTGKTKQVVKTITVEEAEFEYLVKCSDD